MQFCKNCHIRMEGVMSFSKDKHERFCRCPKCYSESRHRRVNDDELDFGEILHRNVIKNNTLDDNIDIYISLSEAINDYLQNYSDFPIISDYVS